VDEPRTRLERLLATLGSLDEWLASTGPDAPVSEVLEAWRSARLDLVLAIGRLQPSGGELL
jgi:hypothetical protein